VYAKMTLKGEVEERRKAGLPLYKVEVTKNGTIDGACDGMNGIMHFEGLYHATLIWLL
jgi:hypothetical protein